MKKRILFVMPSVGRKPGSPYVKSWKMEPLPIATLSALTPASRFEKHFADDRLEAIPSDLEVDAVAITTETYTARRAYQIAEPFRRRGIPVILGGFHATLMPEECAEHATTVVTGAAEGVWDEVLDDLEAGSLKSCYHGSDPSIRPGFFPDRSIYAGKRYVDLAMLETSRGCRYTCEFCSITSFFEQQWAQRPIEDVVEEIKRTAKRNWFFVDDNLGSNLKRLEKLLEALVPLRIRWVGQISIQISRHPSLLRLLKRSGCVGVLIGFESIHPANLSQMGKDMNRSEEAYEEAIRNLRTHGLAVYGTFVFGYDHDRPQTFEDTYDFCVRNKLFFAAFNHLVPFPGTRLYERLQSEDRLLHKAWWLNPDYQFGDIAFQPEHFTPQELGETCVKYRRKFYSPGSILRRGLDRRANCRTPFMALLFFAQNIGSGRDVLLRQNLPLGFIEP